jgi:micrococcal nuclease
LRSRPGSTIVGVITFGNPSRSLSLAVLAVGVLVACQSSPSESENWPTPTQEARATPDVSHDPAPPSSTASLAPTGRTEEALVTDVVDGDTIRVEIDGTEYTLRYIGIDTPETVDPRSEVQWMGPEASAANSLLVADRTVHLEKDVSETDQFGRLLRYVWLQTDAGWLLVNLELVRLGFAYSSAYPPDVAYQDLFDAAEVEAREAQAGLWGATPPPEPDTGGSTAPPPPAVGNCDPSYPTVCIPPPPPELDCADITFRRFQVLPPDPHSFDGNRDGVGCEGG